jgi:hypothetical protein
MEKLVYNIVWADDEIDDLLDDETTEDLEAQGFKVIKKAHNGHELEVCFDKPEQIDAVIVDANFNERAKKVESERVTTGLDYARSIYVHKLNRSIPFFLFTGRSDEMLKDVYKDRSEVLDEFPRHTRWFNKLSSSDFSLMLEAIKQTVDERNSPSFIVRNRYYNELKAAAKIYGAEDFIFEFLLSDYENRLKDMVEPFIRMRRIIEKIFTACENLKIIPPISDDVNGTSAYLFYNKYRKQDATKTYKYLYRMKEDIIRKPIAQSLNYLVEITQDASHSKGKLKLKVDEYFENTKDTLLLKSNAFILIDVVRWFAETSDSHKESDVNEIFLWEPINNNVNTDSEHE